jgi:hypothetical protein
MEGSRHLSGELANHLFFLCVLLFALLRYFQKCTSEQHKTSRSLLMNDTKLVYFWMCTSEFLFLVGKVSSLAFLWFQLTICVYIYMNLQMVQNGEHKCSTKCEVPIVEEKTPKVWHLIWSSLFTFLAFYFVFSFLLILFTSQNHLRIFCMFR